MIWPEDKPRVVHPLEGLRYAVSLRDEGVCHTILDLYTGMD